MTGTNPAVLTDTSPASGSRESSPDPLPDERQQAPGRPALIREMVVKVMEDIPETRNDDRKLLTALLNRYFPKALQCPRCGENLEGIDFGPTPETIRRRRQEIQNDPNNPRLIPTNPEILEQRKFYRLCPAEILSEERFTDGKTLKAVCRKCQVVRKGECSRKELQLEVETWGGSA